MGEYCSICGNYESVCTLCCDKCKTKIKQLEAEKETMKKRTNNFNLIYEENQRLREFVKDVEVYCNRRTHLHEGYSLLKERAQKTIGG